MSDVDISTAAVERLMDGVTDGPWVREAQGVYHSNGHGLVAHLKAHEWQRDWPTLERDARFIAASRDLVPALLADRDLLAAEVARLTAERDKVVARNTTVQGTAHVLPNAWDLARVIWEARKYAAWGKDAGAKLIERTPWQNHATHPLVATEHELAHAEAKAALRAIAASIPPDPDTTQRK